MKFGYPISFVLHGAALFGGMVLYSGKVLPTMEGRVIPVEMITVAEFTNIKAAIKAPTPEEITEPEEPMRLENPIENAPEEAPEETPAEPEPETPDEIVEEVAEAVPSEEPEEIPEEVEEVPKEPEKPAFDLDKFAALVDKSRETQPDKNQQKTLVAEANAYEFAETSREGSGDQTKLTLSELDALQSKMYKCWRMSVDAKNPQDLVVRVQVKLQSDGQVLDVKLLDNARIATSGDPYLKIAADRALRAVKKCAPYDFLPEEKYSAWKDMTLNFRPEV